MSEIQPVLSRVFSPDEAFRHQAARSVAAAKAAWDNGEQLKITDVWADVTKWTGGANKPTVSGGYMVAQASPGAGSGMTLIGATIKPWQNAIFQCEVVLDNVANSGGIIIGWSKDADLATPAASAANAYGLYAKGQTISSMNLGSETAITVPDSAPGSGTFLCTAALDESYVSITLSKKSTPSKQYRFRLARPANTDLIPFVFNSCSQTTKKVGPLQFKAGFASADRSTGIVRNGCTIVTTVVNGANIKVAAQEGYDSRIPRPVIMQFHGNGSDENLFSDNGAQQAAYEAFINAGFIVCSARYSSSGSTWGAQASLDAYVELYRYLIGHFAIGPIVFYANSMGSIESLLCINEGRIKGVVGYIGHSPTYDLAANYANATFTTTIDNAYGITGVSPNTYAEKTAGHDPALFDATAFRGLPMVIYAAEDDMVVSKSLNGDALYAKVRSISVEAVNVSGITGGHSFSTSAYASSMVEYAKKWAGI
jgi:pimeloyl-ACP methyl ester carboxylesterase